MVEELLRNRIMDVKEEFIREFNTWAITRQIFEISPYSIVKWGDIADEDYVQIGVNNIIDKRFFTEQKGKTYYDHKGLGSHYGKSLAFGEMTYVFNIMTDCKDVIELNKNDISEYLEKYINRNNDIDNLVILMSPVNLTTFWGNNEFTIVNHKSLWGFINHIPMYWTPKIPRDKFYIFKKNIGKIIIKKDAHIDISEISKSEYDSIIENIPTVTKDELKNHVRVKANEVITFDD